MVNTKIKTKTLVAVAIATLFFVGIVAGFTIIIKKAPGSSTNLPPTGQSGSSITSINGTPDTPGTSTYRVRAKMSGTQTCDSGLVARTSISCSMKHITAFDTASSASINTTSNSVTVNGYDGSGPNPICTNTVTMTDNGDKFIGPFGLPDMSGTATCSYNGITYTAYGEKTGSGSTPSQASCSFTFNPNPITKGQAVTAIWTSAGDADGIVKYVCKCADGSCEKVNSAYGGVMPDIYEQGELSVSGSSTTFSPPETVDCTMTLVDSAGSQKTCTGKLTVNSETPGSTGAYSVRAQILSGTYNGKAVSCDSGQVYSDSTTTGFTAKCEVTDPSGKIAKAQGAMERSGMVSLNGSAQYTHMRSGSPETGTETCYGGGTDTLCGSTTVERTCTLNYTGTQDTISNLVYKVTAQRNGNPPCGCTNSCPTNPDVPFDPKNPGSCVVGSLLTQMIGGQIGTWIMGCSCSQYTKLSDQVLSQADACAAARTAGVCLTGSTLCP